MTKLTNSLRTYAAERRARGNQAVQFNENITGWIEEAAAEIDRLTAENERMKAEVAVLSDLLRNVVKAAASVPNELSNAIKAKAADLNRKRTP